MRGNTNIPHPPHFARHIFPEEEGNSVLRFPHIAASFSHLFLKTFRRLKIFDFQAPTQKVFRKGVRGKALFSKRVAPAGYVIFSARSRDMPASISLSERVIEKRTKPSPDGPIAEPGSATIPVLRSRCSQNLAEDSKLSGIFAHT